MSAFRESSHLGATSPVREFSFPTQNTYPNQGNRQVYASNVAPYNHGLNTINPPTASIQRPPMPTTSYVANPVNQIQTYPIQQQRQVTYSNSPSQPTVVYHQGSVEPKRDTIVRDPIVQKRVIHVEDQPVGQYQSEYIADQRDSRRYYQRHQEGYKPKPTSSICNPCCLSILGLLLLAGLLVGGYFIVQAIQNGAGEPQKAKREDVKYEGTYRQVDIEEGDDGQAIIDNGEEETPLSPAVVDIEQNPEPANHTVKKNETSPAVIQSDSNPAPSSNTTTQNTTSSNTTVKNQAPTHNLKVTKTEPIVVKQGSEEESKQKKEKDPLVIRVKPSIVRQQQEQKQTETQPEQQEKEEEEKQQKQQQENVFQEQNQNEQSEKESQVMTNTQQEKSDDEQQQNVAVFVVPEPEQATQTETQARTEEEEKEEEKPEKKGLPEIMFQKRPEKKGSKA